MTVISAGTCTLFVPQPLLAGFSMVSGAFLYGAAIINLRPCAADPPPLTHRLDVMAWGGAQDITDRSSL